MKLFKVQSISVSGGELKIIILNYVVKFAVFFLCTSPVPV